MVGRIVVRAQREMRHEGLGPWGGERGAVRRVVALVLVVAALAAPRADAKDAAPPEHAAWSGRYSVIADGQRADGWLAYPTDIAPDTLLVFAHGCCGPLPGNWADLLALHHARHNGMVVVAMDYRGPLGGWNVGSGHSDLIAATEDLQRRFPIKRTIVWGVSMGGEVSGMAVAARPDLFDYWISSSGVLDLPTQWGQQTFRAQIEAETHGTPMTARAAYDRRSPVALARGMRGLRHAYVIHGMRDTAVPVSEAHLMARALRDAGVPASTYTVATSNGDVTLWWPMFHAQTTPIGPAGHDWSTIALAQRVLLEIVAGRAPDSGRSVQHVWDSTSDFMTP
jgi:dipeptidyl aminopeptidase/acylaminoacyl peptidase